MDRQVAKNKKTVIEHDGVVVVWCPGCKNLHSLYIPPHAGRPQWQWDGNLEAPTFTPSLLITWRKRDNTVFRRCHSYIRNGQWQFLSDCTHELAGKTVDMVELQDWVLEE